MSLVGITHMSTIELYSLALGVFDYLNVVNMAENYYNQTWKVYNL